MIDKREIIDAAAALGLNPHVVEKDYVLGWLLWGISSHSDLKESWVFKGGTCLKKCFFETYRFSEDLDFTLKDESHLDPGFLSDVFSEISERVYEETGIGLPVDAQTFEIFNNPRGNKSCMGRIGYQGPVSPRGKSMPRIKLDLTADERLVLEPVHSPVFHPYSDCPENGIQVLSYAYEEAFGEKVRALAERTRPRDLYDVVNLFRNDAGRPAASVLLDVLRQKCEFKGIAVPVLIDLEPFRQELEAGWETMLAHQLPALPSVENFWSELPEFFDWMSGRSEAPKPVAYVGAAGEEVLRERTQRLPVSLQAQSALDIIRFAASNRLCVDLVYQGSTRRIEPYSLRRTQDGNIILHAFKTADNEHRSYRVDRIQGASVTNQSFIPRYAVELTATGPVSIEPTSRSSFSGMQNPKPSNRSSIGIRRPARRRGGALGGSQGRTYIYECSFCGKQFRRKTQATALNPHKDKSGFPCSGRYAHLVDTKW